MILKRTMYLIPLLITGVSSANNLVGEVNPYDCTVEEVQIFMLKKTESMRTNSAIATWEDFKKGAVPVTTAASGGHPANSAENSAVGGVTEEETCPMFFTNAQLSDLKIDVSSFSIKNLVGLFNGDLSSLADSAKDNLSNLSESLISELEKGICERLSSEYLGGKIDGALKNETGFGLNNLTSESFINNLIKQSMNDAIDGSLGIYNIFDPNFVNKANNILESEIQRQTKEFDSIFLN